MATTSTGSLRNEPVRNRMTHGPPWFLGADDAPNESEERLMIAASRSRPISSFQFIPHAASASAVLGGCLVLAGWLLDIPALKSVVPGLVTMKANTALAFILAGVALWLVQAESAGLLHRRVAHVCTAIVALVGLLTLSEYLVGWDLGIDQLLFRDSLEAINTSSPGRMAPVTALNFLLVGGALLLLDVQTRGGYRPAQFLALATGASSLMTLIGYVYSVGSLYRVASFTAVALHTAVLFIALALGILFARPNYGYMEVMTHKNTSGFIVRRLTVMALTIPIVLGLMRLVGQRAGLYDTEIGLSFMVMSTIGIATSIVCWAGRSLLRAERERERAEEIRREISKLGVLLSRSLRLEEVYPAFAAAVKTILLYDRLGIIVSAGESLVMVHSVADPPLHGWEGCVWPKVAGTSVAWVLAHRTPRVVTDLTIEHAFTDDLFIAREGVRSTMMLPLLVRGEAVGILVLDSRTPGVYTEEHATLLGLVTEALALALQNSRLYAQVTRHADELEHLVEARTRELHAANGHLADASRHKSAFLANMSHELRTPLNAILGFAELLQDQISGPLIEKQARYANHIQTSGRHLLALINDLLDLSKVEAGKLTLRPEPFVLSEALAAILHELQPVADAKRLTLTLDTDTAPATLTADPIRFKQILYNLLSNAIKFSPEDGQITVAARRALSVKRRASSVEPEPATLHAPPSTLYPESDFVEIAVTDSGIGIKAEELTKLFQPFTQLQLTAEKHAQGTGLGLALTKHLVELHGGTIEAASAGEGQGSTFTVRLPLAPQASPEN